MTDHEAFFSDRTEMFCSPMEADQGDTVTIRFRVAKKDEPEITVVAVSGIPGDTGAGAQTELPMTRESSEGDFAFYSAGIVLGSGPLSYCFRISAGDGTWWYSAAVSPKRLPRRSPAP